MLWRGSRIISRGNLQGKVPRYFGHGHGLRMTEQDPSGGGTALRMTGLVVVLSSAKDLVLLLKSLQPRFFRPAAFRMTPLTHPRSFGR